MHEIVEDDLSKDVIPYGKPIANNRYYILNENKRQLPVGVTGTLYCAGIGVANGYCEDVLGISLLFGKKPENVFIILEIEDIIGKMVQFFLTDVMMNRLR